jgi:hypothetical protein
LKGIRVIERGLKIKNKKNKDMNINKK